MLRSEAQSFNTAFLSAFICFFFNLCIGLLCLFGGYDETFKGSLWAGIFYIAITSLMLFISFHTSKGLTNNFKVRKFSPLEYDKRKCLFLDPKDI